MPSQQPHLALHGRRRLQAGSRHGGCQPAGRDVLVQVAGLELDQVDLAAPPPHPVQVALSEHCALAEVRSQVMNQHASFYVMRCRRGSGHSDCFHLNASIESE